MQKLALFIWLIPFSIAVCSLFYFKKTYDRKVKNMPELKVLVNEFMIQAKETEHSFEKTYFYFFASEMFHIYMINAKPNNLIGRFNKYELYTMDETRKERNYYTNYENDSNVTKDILWIKRTNLRNNEEIYLNPKKGIYVRPEVNFILR